MINFVVITVSDRGSRGEREDLSGPEIIKWVENHNYNLFDYKVVPDEIEILKENFLIYSAMSEVNVILTTGGTGFAPRDVTPEATTSVIEKKAPGFAEVMRMKSLEITPHAMLSRAVSGIRKNTLIINLPGSPKAVRENLSFIEKGIPHAVELLKDNVDSCGSD